MSVAYINYHRQPRVNFTSVSEYNQKFNSNVPENEAFEKNFKVALAKARTETDPNEYIQHQFDVDNMGLLSSMGKMASKAKAAMKKKLAKKEKKKAKKVETENPMKESPVEAKPSLDEFLDDYEEETHYEEVVETNVHDEIKSFVAEQAKDSESLARDLAHVVHFNTNSPNVSERLMKGRDRYMKRLQDYVDGDSSVKVRMMNNKEVLVAALNPNVVSLREMLASPHGEPRFCKCD